MGTNWHELRDLGNERAHRAIDDADQRARIRRVERGAKKVGSAVGSTVRVVSPGWQRALGAALRLIGRTYPSHRLSRRLQAAADSAS
jgi:hypothetical protein